MTNDEINWYFWQKYIPRAPKRLKWFPVNSGFIDAAIKIKLSRLRDSHLLLSGGIDSSVIAVYSRPQQAYTLVQYGSYNESWKADCVAGHLGIPLKRIHMLSHIDMVIPEIIKGEPFGDSSVVALYQLCKLASEYSDTFVTGDGADEIFGGYDTYKAYKLAEWMPNSIICLLKKWPNQVSEKKVTLGFKVNRFCRDFGAPPLLRHFRWMGTFGNEERRRLLGDRFVNDEDLLPAGYGDTLDELQRADVDYYYEFCMKEKAKRAAGAAGVKLLAPFADYAGFMLSEKYRVRGLTTKWLLRNMLRGQLPKKIIQQKKKGFTVPVSNWIKNSELIRAWTCERCDTMLNHDYIKEMYEAHIRGLKDYARELWLVFVWNYSRKVGNNEKNDA